MNMNKINKIALKTIVVLVSMTLLLGCTAIESQEEQQEEQIELNIALIAAPQYKLMYDAQIPKFEEETGIKVNIIAYMHEAELPQKIKMELPVSPGKYDFVGTHNELGIDHPHLFEDLRPFLSQEDREDFTELSLSLLTLEDGYLWGLPRNVDFQVLAYRSDLFEDPEEQAAFKEEYGYELGPPRTFDEWLDAAEFFYRPPDLYGVGIDAREFMANLNMNVFLHSYGGDWIDYETWEVTVNSEEGQKALMFYRDLAQLGPPGVPSYGWEELQLFACTGKAATWLMWPSQWVMYSDPDQCESAKFGVDVAMIPSAAPDKDPVVGGGGYAWAIPKSSNNKEAAWELMKFLTSTETQFLEWELSGFLPVRKSAWNRIIEAAEVGDPKTKKLFEIQQFALEEYFIPNIILLPEWTKINDMAWPKFQMAVAGERDVKETLDDIAEGIRAILEKEGYYE